MVQFAMKYAILFVSSCGANYLWDATPSSNRYWPMMALSLQIPISQHWLQPLKQLNWLARCAQTVTTQPSHQLTTHLPLSIKNFLLRNWRQVGSCTYRTYLLFMLRYQRLMAIAFFLRTTLMDKYLKCWTLNKLRSGISRAVSHWPALLLWDRK